MRIVVVSPFPAERTALQAILEEDGYVVTAVATRGEALDVTAEEIPDVVIADVRIAGPDGNDLAEALATHTPTPLLIVLSARASRRGLANGIVSLTKPIDLAQLRRYLGYAIPPQSQSA